MGSRLAFLLWSRMTGRGCWDNYRIQYHCVVMQSHGFMRPGLIIKNKRIFVVVTMKNPKRILDQLLRKAPQFPAKPSQPHIQTLDSSPNLNKDRQQSQSSHKHSYEHEHEHGREQEIAFTFEVFIEIGDGRTGTIVLTQSSSPQDEARRFCRHYQLESYVCGLLAESLAEHIRRERDYVRGGDGACRAVGVPESVQQCREEQVEEQAQGQMGGPVGGGKEARAGPKINRISDEIVKKIGKQNIIEANHLKFRLKAELYHNQRMQRQQKSISTYLFHPSINPISKQVDETLKEGRKSTVRHENLYENYKEIKSRAETKRRNSMTELSFKPAINRVSEMIVARKKSLGDVAVHQHQPTEANCRRRPQMVQNEGSRKDRLEKSRSSEKYCLQLYEDARLRQEKLQKEVDRVYKHGPSWKIIDSSNSLIQHMRRARVKQIFHGLCQQNSGMLYPQEVNYENLSEVEQIFMPIFDEMKQLNQNLNEEEFVSAGMRLINYLSPEQRARLIRRKHRDECPEKENQRRRPQLNRKSQQIVREKNYISKSIYHRGLMFRKEVKDQIDKGKEEKVRRELNQCTFKPKVNRLATNIRY